MKQISTATHDEGNQNCDILQNLVYGFLNKNMKDAAVSMILDVLDNKIEDVSDKGLLRYKLVKGDYDLCYDDFDSVDYYRLAHIGQDEWLGFLSFKNDNEEILFFFCEDDGEIIDDVYSYISNKINKKNKSTNTYSQQTDFSPADEIMKYKNLLDAEAITEKEYKAKKKQLLSL